MPELPEVEIIARRLREGSKREPKIVGKTIVEVKTPSSKAVKSPSTAAFAKSLTGARFVDVQRRAKHLLLVTDRGTVMVHLRLTGDLHVVPPGVEPKFVRVELVLDDDAHNRLVFTDGRHIGEVRFLPSDEVDKRLGDLGPEPLDPSWTVDKLAAVMKGKRAVKAVLLDQQAVGGVGNIYSDEACWHAKLHPATTASKMSPAQSKRLHAGILKALRKSIDELVAEDMHIEWRYTDRDADSSFAVYDRAGKPCRRCGKKLKSATIGGRTSVFCTTCQKKT